MMTFLATVVVILVLLVAGYWWYKIELKEDDSKKVAWHKAVTWILLTIFLLNSATFTIVRLALCASYGSGKPKLVTLQDAGTYQTDEVHYLIAGTKMRPEDIEAILPDNLHGTIKAVKYWQFHYNASSVMSALNDDVRRNGYETVTIWAVGTGAISADSGTLSVQVRDHSQIILIDPCPNTLVLKPELQETVESLAPPWGRALAYLSGWVSLNQFSDGCSLNLNTMLQYELSKTSTSTLKPNTDNVIGLVTSEQDEYLQTEALKGLYADAIQESVAAPHADIVRSSEQYKAALEKIWAQHMAKIGQAEAEDDIYDDLLPGQEQSKKDYTGPFPEDPT